MGHSGDPTALDRLVRTHLPETLRFATRLTGSLDSAEDVVQEALVRVTRSWATFRGESDFRTWLFRIVINVFRDRLSHERTTAGMPGDTVDRRAADPGDSAIVNELSRIIAQKISTLPPRQREVLVLMSYENLTPQQTAEVLGITVGNVHVTLHLARERLREELAPWMVEK